MGIFQRKKGSTEIDPDVIFLDSVNLPDFNTQQFEGRLERPISKRSVVGLGVVFALCIGAYAWKIGDLQVVNGQTFRERSSYNTLKQIPVFGERGTIVDRNGVELALNTEKGRSYLKEDGLAHVLGYVGLPTKRELASSTEFSTEEYIGKAGVEKAFNDELRGASGLKLAEVDAKGVVQTENVYRPPLPGATLALSIDQRLQTELYKSIQSVAEDRGFTGGAGVMMDVRTGEIVAMTSYPEYNPTTFAQGDDAKYISETLNDSKRLPLLNRALSGIYTPGSVIKPIMATAALSEHVVTPDHEILSTGSISIQSPYDKNVKTVFRDWQRQGYLDMPHAIAMSSDVYFYEVGGGFEGQKGLGIANIDKYMRMFGLAQKTGIELDNEGVGVIPTPEWKAANFNGEDWRIGDTYHTSIGQYGFGVTPLQMVRAIAAIASYGKLFTPTMRKIEATSSVQYTTLSIDKKVFDVVHDGMRLSATIGTGKGLNVPYVEIASKTGTAELGVSKAKVNSWVEGFFPYKDPKYAFAIVMEKGPVHNTIGGVFVARQMFDWMNINTPEYFK